MSGHYLVHKHLILGSIHPRRAMSSSSGTTTLESSSSMSSSNELVGGSGDTGSSHVGRQAAPATSRKVLSNRNVVSEIKKCQVTGFVNFVEAQPSVGRFRADDHEPPLQMAARSPPGIKIADVLAPTMAPECNYGVFNPSGVAEGGPTLAPPRVDDLHG